MQAIVRTGNKQYSIKEGDIIKVEKLEGKVGDEVILDDVLMVKGDGEGAVAKVGTPRVTGARVKGEIVEQGRGKKIIVFTYKRRKGFAKKIGHRQDFTAILVKEILPATK